MISLVNEFAYMYTSQSMFLLFIYAQYANWGISSFLFWLPATTSIFLSKYTSWQRFEVSVIYRSYVSILSLIGLGTAHPDLVVLIISLPKFIPALSTAEAPITVLQDVQPSLLLILELVMLAVWQGVSVFGYPSWGHTAPISPFLTCLDTTYMASVPWSHPCCMGDPSASFSIVCLSSNWPAAFLIWSCRYCSTNMSMGYLFHDSHDESPILCHPYYVWIPSVITFIGLYYASVFTQSSCWATYCRPCWKDRRILEYYHSFYIYFDWPIGPSIMPLLFLCLLESYWFVA